MNLEVLKRDRVYISLKANLVPNLFLYIVIIGLVLLFQIGYNSIIASIPFLLIGIGYSGAAIGNFSIMGDVIDNDELITGKRREAIYGGVNAIVTKPSVSIGNIIFLALIHAFGYESGQQTQTPIAVIGLMIAFCLVPAILTYISPSIAHKAGQFSETARALG